MLPSKSLLTSLLLLAGICVAPLPAFARPVAVREPSLARRDTSDGALARRLYAPSRRNASPLIYARKVASHSNDDDADDDADDTADDDGPGFADDLAKGGRKAADLTESSVNTAVGMTEGTIRGVARVTTNAGKSVFNSAWGMTKDAAGAIGDGIGGMFSHSGASTETTEKSKHAEAHAHTPPADAHAAKAVEGPHKEHSDEAQHNSAEHGEKEGGAGTGGGHGSKEGSKEAGAHHSPK